MWIAKRHPMMRNALRNESGVFATYTMAVVAVAGCAIGAALVAGSVRSVQPETSTPRLEAVSEPVLVDAAVTSLHDDSAQLPPAAAAPQVESDTATTPESFPGDAVDQTIWRG